MRLLSEMSRNSDIANQIPRWPIVDQSRPYVCQHCGVGFAREKVRVGYILIYNKVDNSVMLSPEFRQQIF